MAPPGGSVSFRYQLVHCYNVSKISFSFRRQLWRLCDVLTWLVTYVPVGTLLRRLKLVSFIYVPVRHCKDVSNRSVSLTYQLQRRDDVLAWSTTYRPIWDLNETSLQGRVPGWLLLLLLAISILSLYLFYCNTTFIRHIYQKLIFINLKKIVCQDNLAFARLQFYKHNCLNILGDNIRFHNQVKSQWKW